MKKTAEAPHYHSFILVCWRDDGEKSTTTSSWRFSLEDPHTGQRHGFANLSEVGTFLKTKLSQYNDKTA